jgi:hypothetical protein
VSRQRTLFVKMGVAAALLTALAALANLILLSGELKDAPATPAEVVIVVWLTAMLPAPALTLLCRGTLAGSIFGGTVLGVVALGGDVIGWIRFDTDRAAIAQFQQLFFWRTMPLVWMASAAVLWRSFVRGDAAEGRGRELHVPQWVFRERARGDRPARGPVWQLVAKELRLQQMVFAIAGIYLTIAVILVLRARTGHDFAGAVLLPITVMYAALLALVAGALAGAEERQLGTIHSQLLLPIDVTRQWRVKAAVVYGVSAGLAIALPAAVILLLPEARIELRGGLITLLVVLLLATASFYVSSLATSGIKALVACVPMVVVGFPILEWMTGFADQLLHALLGDGPWQMHSRTEGPALLALLLFAAGAVALVMRFGAANFRTADHPPARVTGQLGVLVAFAFAGVMVVTALLV